jgi:hypothetical protein
MDELKDNLVSHPLKYTAWFRIAFPMLEEFMAKNKVSSNAN